VLQKHARLETPQLTIGNAPESFGLNTLKGRVWTVESFSETMGKMSDPGSQKAEIELQPEPEVEVASEPARGRRRRRGSIGAESSVNMDELRELIQIINENEFTEFELEREGFRVRFRRGLRLAKLVRARLMRSGSCRRPAPRAQNSSFPPRPRLLIREPKRKPKLLKIRPAHHSLSDRRHFLSGRLATIRFLCKNWQPGRAGFSCLHYRGDEVDE